MVLFCGECSGNLTNQRCLEVRVPEKTLNSRRVSVAYKLKAADGKCCNTDVTDIEEILRVTQSIPSPKAESFKMWLAQFGSERIEEIIGPELTIERALSPTLNEEWLKDQLSELICDGTYNENVVRNKVQKNRSL